ncbi:glycosyltransferase family 39 protein, partial [candidate division KSB1 bacterium]|nr:glycosyltransferase family 39 protein [candidate division KSB1 bacterium]
MLSGFLFLTQMAVVFLFALNLKVNPFVAPAALILALSGGYWFVKREGINRQYRFIALSISLVIVGIFLFAAKAFYDMSWDGLWYHQTAVYQMSHGWNPLHDPLHDFTPHLRTWLRYYAKGPWFVALALFETTHNIEMAKAAPLMIFAATFFAGFALLIDLGFKKRTAAITAALIVLNPVITCELVSYLVDGLMISFLFISIAAMIRWFRKPTALVILIAIMSAVLCINSKFTGLVYLCFFIAAGGIYILIKERKRIWKYLIIQSAAIFAGIVIFGWNPYITNTINRGNPFYPMLGSSAYPSLSAMGQDPIELYETPPNMRGKNRFIRFTYAIFGRPGAYPAYPGPDPVLMLPFDIGWKDFSIYYFHDVRISGFGPLFSGALIFTLFLFVLLLFHRDANRLFLILSCSTIVLSVLISTHTWWARYGPQLWMLPVVIIITGFTITANRVVFWSTRILAAILLINAVLITVVHFR